MSKAYEQICIVPEHVHKIAKSSTPPTQVMKPIWPQPQPEAGPSKLPLPQHEVGPSMQPETSNLRSCIATEVDDYIPDWLMEEQGYMPSTGPATVSKRQQHKGLGLPIEYGAFTCIEDLKKNYLAWSPGNMLTDPTFH